MGGGGRAKFSFAAFWAAEDLRRDLTASAGCTGYGVTLEGEMGWKPEWGDVLVSEGETLEASCVKAAGGNSKASCSEARFLEPSWPFMSVEDAGVGGSVGRGIVRWWNVTTGEWGASGLER